MSSLYIAGIQCVYSKFQDDEEHNTFRKNNTTLSEIAEKHGVYVDSFCIDEDDDNYAFVISNTKPNFECFYSGAAFDVDMEIETNPDFEENVSNFLNELHTREDLNEHHNFKFSEPKKLYFVIS